MDIHFESDVSLLKLCFGNIIGNSIKYTPKGGIIKVDVFQQKYAITLRITDNGQGFSERAMNNIFKLFEPGEDHVNLNMGIGLAQVKLIVDSLKGEVKVRNIPDGGAEVELILPNAKRP